MLMMQPGPTFWTCRQLELPSSLTDLAPPGPSAGWPGFVSANAFVMLSHRFFTRPVHQRGAACSKPFHAPAFLFEPVRCPRRRVARRTRCHAFQSMDGATCDRAERGRTEAAGTRYRRASGRV